MQISEFTDGPLIQSGRYSFQTIASFRDSIYRQGKSGLVRDNFNRFIGYNDTDYTANHSLITRHPGIDRQDNAEYQIWNSWYQRYDVYPARNIYIAPYYQEVLAYFSQSEIDLTAGATNRATSFLLDDMANLKTANLGVSVLEAKQTISLIGDTATRICKAVLAIRRGKIKRAYQHLKITGNTVAPRYLQKRYGIRNANQLQKIQRTAYVKANRRKSRADLLKVASDTWLEVHFGWLPLLQDTYDIAEAVAQIQYEHTPEHFVFTGYATNEDVNTVRYAYEVGTSGTRTCKVGKVWRATSSSVEEWFNRKFGLTSPATVFYEAVPFSFVLDWFLPVGRYLEQVSASSGVDFHSGCDSVKLTENFVGHYSTEVVDGVQTTSKYSSNTYSSEKFTRIKRSYYIPRPPPPSWNFEAVMDPWKLTTAFALMVSLKRLQ